LDVETITTLLSHQSFESLNDITELANAPPLDQSSKDPEDIVETVDAPLTDQSSNDPEDIDEIVNAKLQAMIERTTVYNHETLINKTRCDLESKIAADRAKMENVSLEMNNI
jgi:multidrug efflux pump subunit AcrB